MDDFNKFLDEHELLGTINVSTDDVCEYAGMGKDIGVFQRKKKNRNTYWQKILS